MLFVNGAHEGSRRGQHFIDENENRFLGSQLDSFADHVHKLADSEILGSLPSPFALAMNQLGLTEGTRYFFLSMVGMSVRSAFSQMTCHATQLSKRFPEDAVIRSELTGIRSGYFCRIRSASALRFSGTVTRV